MTSSLSLFAKYNNANISKMKKGMPKRKMPFFFIQIGTLKRQAKRDETGYAADYLAILQIIWPG